MSKDIRSFFSVKSSQKKASNVQESIKKPGQRKRPVNLFESDSDEESSLVSTKRSKPSKSEENRVGSKNHGSSKVASKYFQAEKVSASDVFGSVPIKRDNSRNIIKKSVTKEDKEWHFDEDFESELLLLDAVDTASSNDNTSKEHSNNEQVLESSCSSVKEIEKPDSIKETKPNKNKSSSPDKQQTQLQSCISMEVDDVPVKKTKLVNGRKGSPSKQPSPNKSDEPPLKKIRPSRKSPTKKTPSPQKNQDTCQDKSSTKLNADIEHFTRNSVTSKSERKYQESNEKQVSINKPDRHVSECLQKKPKVSSNETKAVDDVHMSSGQCSLWVEKYKPVTTKQIIGQHGNNSCVNKLTHWLKNWLKNHEKPGNNKLVKPGPWAKNDDGAYYKAALLSGPPGVGKTTSAHLVARELGFDVVEFNASDTRSKKLLHQEVSELLSTNSLSPFFTGKAAQVSKQHVLLMDEVDGMAGNEDRGGVQELIQLIKQSRVPIICMCNDRNHPKIRSLANYCFDLRFSKPRVEQIKGAMMSLCFKEKLKLAPDAVTEIITSANQDIRLIINHLSMLAIESKGLSNSTKHIKMGPWDIVRKVFSAEEHKSMSFYDKSDLFFHDYSITPLFVQDNYLNVVPHKPEAKNKIKKMELFAAAARSISLGDLTEKSIRSHNAWGLLPVQAIFSSLAPGEILEGHVGGQINFPAWFGKNSRQTKMNRLLQELTVHSRLKISGNKEAMNLDYLVPLGHSVLAPLTGPDGLQGVSQALSVLTEYSLLREDLDSIIELSSWPNSKSLFSQVESKVKAALTRAYNKTSTPTPYAAVPIKKGSKVDTDNTDTLPEEDEDQGVDDEEEEEGMEVDAMIVVKKKTGGKKADTAVPSTSKKNKNAKRGRKK